MHILQPKHTRLSQNEVNELNSKFNITISQLPKIALDDKALQPGCNVGDVIRIERKDGDQIVFYYRVVV